MKSVLKTALLLFSVMALVTTACKKDDEKSASDRLTGTSCWQQVKSETQDPTTGTWTDDGVDACDRDDCTNFNSDGTLTFDEGATKCDPADPQTTTGSWVLSNDGNTLTITDNTTMLTIASTVVELTDNRMVLEIEILGFKNRTTFEAN